MKVKGEISQLRNEIELLHVKPTIYDNEPFMMFTPTPMMNDYTTYQANIAF